MAIEIKCEHCSRVLNLYDKRAGFQAATHYRRCSTNLPRPSPNLRFVGRETGALGRDKSGEVCYDLFCRHLASAGSRQFLNSLVPTYNETHVSTKAAQLRT